MLRSPYDHYRKYRKKPRRLRSLRRPLVVLIGFAGFLLALVALNSWVLLRPARLNTLIEEVLADHLTGRISFRQVSLHPIKGLQLIGINVIPESREGSLQSVTGDATIRFDLASLLQGKLELSSIILSNFKVSIARDPKLGWHFTPLVRTQETSRTPSPTVIPQIDLREGVLVVRDHIFLKPGQEVILSGIDLWVRPESENKLYLSGRFRDRTFGNVKLNSTFDTKTGFEELKVSADGFFPTESFRQKLNKRLGRYLDTIGAKGSLNAELLIRPPSSPPPQPQTQPIGEVPSVAEAHRRDRDDRVTLRLWGNDLELTPPDFPYAFPDVEGSIVLNLTSIKLERLRAVRGPTVIRASGEFFHYLDPVNLVGELKVKTESLRVDSWLRRALPVPGQEAWDAFSPEGTLDVSVTVGRTASENPWDVEARVDLRGMDVTYQGFYNKESGRRHGFPYLIRHLVGTVGYSEGTATIDIRGKTNGAGTIDIDGSMEGSSIGAVDLTIVAHDLPLDKDLEAALNEKARRFYTSAKPNGRTGVVVDITRARGPDQKPRIVTTADIHDSSFEYAAFPYPVEHAQGTIVIANEEFRIVDLECFQGDAEFEIDVDIRGKGESLIQKIEVLAKNLKIDEKLRLATAALSSNTLDKIWEDYRPTGLLDGQFSLTRRGIVDPAFIRLDGEVREGTSTIRSFPVEVENITGRFHLIGADVHLDRFDGKRGESPVWFEGKILSGDRAAESFLRIGGDRIAIDEPLIAAALKSTAVPGETLKSLDPTGAFDLRCQFKAGTKLQLFELERLTLEAQDAAISHPWIPGRFEGITGSIIIEENEKITLNDIRGRLRGGTASADGTIQLHADRPPSVDLTIKAKDLNFDDQAEEEIEGAIAAVIKKHHPRGKISTEGLELNIFTKDEDPEQSLVQLGGTLDFQDFEVDLGIKIKDWTGRLTLEKVLVGTTGYDFVLHSHGASARVLGYRIDDLSAKIEGIEDDIRLRDIRGKMYGGEIDTKSSEFEMHTKEPLDYRGSFRVSEMQIRDLLVDQGRPVGPISGKADFEGNVYRGEGDGLQAIRGEGKLRIYDARLFAIPILTKTLSVLQLSDPPVFTDALADFEIKQGGFAVDPVEIYSVLLSVKGDGFVNFGGELDFSLAIRIIPDLPSIPLIDLPISLINRSLFGIRVKGPLEDPVISSDNVILNTFSFNEKQVRRLLPPQPRKRVWGPRF